MRDIILFFLVISKPIPFIKSQTLTDLWSDLHVIHELKKNANSGHIISVARTERSREDKGLDDTVGRNVKGHDLREPVLASDIFLFSI